MSEESLGKRFINLFLIFYAAISCVTVGLFLAKRSLSFYADVFSILSLLVIYHTSKKSKKHAKIDNKTLSILTYFIAFTGLHLYLTQNFVAIKVGVFCCTFLLCRIILKNYNYKIIELLLKKICLVWIFIGCIELFIRLLNPLFLPSIINQSNQIVTRGLISINSGWGQYAICSLGLSQGSFACIAILSCLIFYKSNIMRFISVFAWIFCGTLTSLVSFVFAKIIQKKYMNIFLLVSFLFILFYSEILNLAFQTKNTPISNFAHLSANLDGTYMRELIFWPMQNYIEYKPILVSIFGNLVPINNFVPKYAENKLLNIILQIPLVFVFLYCKKTSKEICLLQKKNSLFFCIFIFILLAANKCGFYYTAPGCILFAIILNIPSLYLQKSQKVLI